MNKVDVLLGLQWGDEGKGKLVDFITPHYDIIARFQGGANAGHTLIFDGKKYVTEPCKAKKLDSPPDFSSRPKKIRDERHGPTSWVSLILTEGKFKQVRKMTAAVGFPTLRLVRVRIGQIKLDKMTPGEVIEVKTFSI